MALLRRHALKKSTRRGRGQYAALAPPLPVAAGHLKAAGKLVHLLEQLLHVCPARTLCRQVLLELLELAGGGRLGLAVLQGAQWIDARGATEAAAR